jgi:hypothetical protein
MPASIFQPLTRSLTTLSSVACDLVRLVVVLFRSRRALTTENIFLRKQLALFQARKVKPHRAHDSPAGRAGDERMTEPYTLSGWLRKAQENADGTLTVTGIASDASEPDCDNEVIDIERSWPYFEKRMEKMRASSGGRNCLVRTRRRAGAVVRRIDDGAAEGRSAQQGDGVPAESADWPNRPRSN